MKLKLLKDWNGNKPGDILPTVPVPRAEILISRGIAEEVKDEKPKAKKTTKAK